MAYVGDTPLRVALGMTGDQTLTANGILYGNGTSPFGVTNAGVNGQMCVGATSGAPSFSDTSAGSFTFSTAAVGASVTLAIENTDNTNAASHAVITNQVGGSAGGVMRSQYVITGGTSHMIGVNNAATTPEADPFSYNAGTTNFNATWNFQKSGLVTMPRTTAFLSFLATDVSNVTGQSATYTLGAGTALTEVFDQASNITTAGLFTAPVTGRYDLRFTGRVIGVLLANKFNIALVTSNRTYVTTLGQVASALNQSLHISAICDMDSGDTCTFQIAVTGEAADTDDIDGASGTLVTWCCGSMVA